MRKAIIINTVFAFLLLTGCSADETSMLGNVTDDTQGTQNVFSSKQINNLVLVPGSQTRAGNGTWEVGDKLGLAWFDIMGMIFQLQERSAFDGVITPMDDKIYSNHLFTVNEERIFTAKSNIYQGAYFVYAPFEYMSSITEKVVNVNSTAYAPMPEGTTASNDLSYDRFNRAFHISPIDFIEALDSRDPVLKHRFNLSPVVNCVSFNLTPSAGITGSDVLSTLAVTGYTMTELDGNKAFPVEYTIVPTSLPKAHYTADGILDAAADKASIDAYILEKVLPSAVYTESVSRSTAAGAYHLGEAISYPLYIMPVKPIIGDSKLSFTLHFTTGHGVPGSVVVSPASATESEANRSALSTLCTDLNTKYTAIRRTASGSWTFKNVNLTVDGSNLQLHTTDIKNIDQWNDAVSVLNALGATTATFNVTGDIRFSSAVSVLKATNGKITVTNGGGKLIYAKGIMPPLANRLAPVSDVNVVKE